MGTSFLDLHAWLPSRHSLFPSERLHCSYSFQASSLDTNLEPSFSLPQHQCHRALLADPRISPLLPLLSCSIPSSFCSLYPLVSSPYLLSWTPQIQSIQQNAAGVTSLISRVLSSHLPAWKATSLSLSGGRNPNSFPWSLRCLPQRPWALFLLSGSLFPPIPSHPPARAPHFPLSGPYFCMLPHHWLDFSLASSPSAKNLSILQGLVPS